MTKLMLRKSAHQPPPLTTGCKLACLGFFLVLFGSCRPVPPPPSAAESIRDQALAQAKRENKRVFLLFTQPGCEWCRRFDVFHADPAVSAIYKRHLVVGKVDIIDTPGGEVLYYEHGTLRNTPAFSVLDSKGMILSHSGDSQQNNVGYPNLPPEIAGYLVALQEAIPEMTAEELDILRERLEALRSAEHLNDRENDVER